MAAHTTATNLTDKFLQGKNDYIIARSSNFERYCLNAVAKLTGCGASEIHLY